MLNLIRCEIFKLRKSKAFYICLLVGCALMTISIATMQLMSTMLKENPEMLVAMNSSMTEMGDGGKVGVGMSTNATVEMMSEPSMLKYMQSVFSDNSLQLIIGVFLSIYIASEYHNGTIKNLACRGRSRWEIYSSKLFAGTLGAVALSLGVFLFSFLVSGCLWGFETGGAFWGKLIRMLALELYLTVSLSAVFISVASMLRSMAGSIAVNLCLLMFAGLVFQLVNLLLGEDAAVQNYWITTNFISANQFDIAAKTIWRILGVGAGYFLVFTGLGALSLQKRDV